MKKGLVIAFILFACHQLVLSQDDEYDDTEHHRVVYKSHTDSTIKNVRDFITHGVVTGNVRNYFMATINDEDLYDYYSNAWGGRLGYTTGEFHGFQVGVQGIFVYNVASNDITRIDPTVDKGARYEPQLYNVTEIHNRRDLDRLEELYLYYNFRNSYVEIGKLNKNTPLINPQDSRMKPYVFEGLWGDFREFNNLRLQLGYFWRVSPRSTTNWYSIHEAIGLYSEGYYADGTPADYQGKLSSSGIGVAGAEMILTDHLKLAVWDYYLDNIMNTVFSQFDYRKNNFIAGLQYLRQDPIGSAGQVEKAYAYFGKDQNANLFSSRVGLKLKKHLLSLNYTKILGTGRFIFPQEFGREQFYTTLPRMRLEGLGNTDALALRYRYSDSDAGKLEIRLEGGLAQTPDVYSYTLNKYNTASFAQGVADVRYRPTNFLKGLAFRFLYVYRQNLQDHNNPELIFNQSHIHHLNLITNISF